MNVLLGPELCACGVWCAVYGGLLAPKGQITKLHIINNYLHIAAHNYELYARNYQFGLLTRS